MHKIGSVFVENFEKLSSAPLKTDETFNNPSCGLIITLIARPNTAGTLPSGLSREENDSFLNIGDHSEVRIQFKDDSGKPVLVTEVGFHWATHPDYTDEDAKQDAIDASAKRITFAEPVRMELRREGKAYAWNNYTPPSKAWTQVEMKNIELDEILFTTSRRGKVHFDHFTWKIA
ncbi:hypothetical protein [Pseudomonas sp. zfem002]|uniref:hypothetical protein n=1 Tax=Pseudomonas sp. zfem002 TaxID=3078197 RepID=UPI002927EF5F|nr:hypothetical protein [Pseudomonas sp. zfem002]MDU9391625.1 hypothetical protein [Pseudomonas sp. zfem002]